MTGWQRHTRLLIAIFVVAFAVVVVFAFKRRAADGPHAPVLRTDPAALVESTAGRIMRVNRTREVVSVEYDRQVTYRDGSTKLLGVKIRSDDRDGRSFTMIGKEGRVGHDDATIVLDGNVTLQASDGLVVRTEHVTDDGMIRAPGPVEFSQKRLSGSGVGMTYDKNADVLVIQDQARVHILPDAQGGATDVTSGAATIARRDRYVRFERDMKTFRADRTIAADIGVVHLTGDEERISSLELHDHARIGGLKAAPGGLESLAGNDMDLKYAADGETLERVLVTGGGALRVAGQPGTPGREIAAPVLDVSLGPDGTTPIAVAGRDGVQVTFPADQASVARTIKATSMDARGEAQKGLTRAVFTGDVDYRERGASTSRAAKAGTLDVMLKPGLMSMDEAVFTRRARFSAEDGLFAVAATARYVLDKGTLELDGSEPGAVRPQMSNERIRIDARRIDVTLEGPRVKAAGDVRSALQAAKAEKQAGNQKADTKMPSMLKGDEPVSIVGENLDYDGTDSKATYTGGAKLWQAETSVQAQTLAIDNKSGDLTASGSVTTRTRLEQRGKGRTTSEWSRSVGMANDFRYEEALRRATYTGDARLSGPQGDMSAVRIELYLQPSGDELDRVEAYDNLTLSEQHRKTTGVRLTYTAGDETYVITGVPVTILDECGRETVGRKLTFVKSTDTINIDGNGQIRTQTRGGGKCS